LALVSQLLILNLVTLIAVLLCLTLMGEPAPVGQLLLLHFAYLILHLEFAALCLSLSALSGKRRGTGLGAGIGLVLGFSLANLVANIAPGLGALKWLTPFAYVDGAEIIPNGSLNLGYVGGGPGLSPRPRAGCHNSRLCTGHIPVRGLCPREAGVSPG